MIIYHGSNVIVKEPHIITSGFYKDFGYGFYCTSMKKQAIKWCKVKNPEHIVNRYNYIENDALKTLRFDEMTEEWLDFITNCRKGIEHTYDIIEGPMADDTIWDYIESYVEGDISRAAFWELVKFKYPTHQIVFCSEDALKCLSYMESENYGK